MKIIGWDFLEMNEHKAVTKGQNQSMSRLASAKLNDDDI